MQMRFGENVYVCCFIIYYNKIGSPAKPLCEANHPIIHIHQTVKFSKDIEALIIDADFEICDNVLDLTPPVHCPLPTTYNGSWVKDGSNILKLIYMV